MGYTASQVAEVLTHLQENDRLPKLDDLAEQLDCGKGTVQAAFELLEDAGAVKRQTRGHLGSFVEEIDHSLLWQFAGGRSITLAMPLPYTRRYEGLASGFHTSFSEVGLPLALAFMRGSVTRLRALREGRVDYVLMSSLAASCEPGLEIVAEFSPGSYVSSHAIILAGGKKLTDPNLRIGIDPSSADVEALAHRVFGNVPVERQIEVAYNQLDQAFKSGLIDATVWNADDIRNHISTDIQVLPLSEAGVDSADTRAVVVRMHSETPVPVAIQQAFTAPIVNETANAVIDGKAVANY